MHVLSIPSPPQGVVHLGVVPIRAYALCIIAGIFFAIWYGERRWVARGGRPGELTDVAIWAVPLGVVGGRLYWVLTESDRYFGPGRDPWGALRVWEGGLGIWGGISLGALGVYIGARRNGLRFVPMLDAIVPGVLVAQAIGRWGNYFNQELFGVPTDLPWALEIAPEHRPPGYAEFATFHPTFLYECLWNLAAFALLVALDKRFTLRHGQMAALYVMAYASGRAWIENIRIDPVRFDDIGGLRFIVWVSMVAVVVAAACLWHSRRRYGATEDPVHRDGYQPTSDDDRGRADAAT